MKHKKLLALLLALAMVFALTACKSATTEESQTPDETVTDEAQSAQPTEEETETPAEALVGVNFAVLSGPTGIGAAKLLSDSDAGATDVDYDYTIAADNSELVAGLTGGTIDIATMASNAAVSLYNKTDGGVTIIALGTLGVLHVLESGGGESVNSIADLYGKTIWSAGQGANPEYILRYLLSENGIDPDKDVELVFADASEITQKLLTGEAEVAMLPVPAATAAIAKSEGSVRAALDVTEEWDALNTGSQLIMTAVVARTEFLEENPATVDTFLSEYAASIDYVNNNIDDAAQLVADLGITASAGIAKQAIPQCHLTFIAGADMAPAISGYYSILYQADPSAVGGALPDDAIYYVP
jgi:NitT/TauT family transport system substrate-binding protein